MQLIESIKLTVKKSSQSGDENALSACFLVSRRVSLVKAFDEKQVIHTMYPFNR
jgi:hypothetical protein